MLPSCTRGSYKPPRLVCERKSGLCSGSKFLRLAARSPFSVLWGAMPAARRSWVHPPHQLWGPGLDLLLPKCPAGHCGPGPGGAVHLYAPGGRQHHPRLRCSAWAGRGGSEAGLSSPARSAEPPRSSAGGASFPRPLCLAPLFSPGPLRPAAEPRRPLGSHRGCAPGTRRPGAGGVLPARLGPLALPASVLRVDWLEIYQLGGLDVNTGRAWEEERIRLSALSSTAFWALGVWFLRAWHFSIYLWWGGGLRFLDPEELPVLQVWIHGVAPAHAASAPASSCLSTWGQ